MQADKGSFQTKKENRGREHILTLSLNATGERKVPWKWCGINGQNKIKSMHLNFTLNHKKPWQEYTAYQIKYILGEGRGMRYIWVLFIRKRHEREQ